MHLAAYSFVADSVAELGPYGTVVEIGSRNLNGSVRDLFVDARRYVGLDVVDGPGVDVVFDPAVGWQPDDLVDVVVSCEVLEHVEAWREVLASAASYLKAGGKLIVTAAGPGRRPHSGITGRRTLEPGEFYRNIEPDALAFALELEGFVDVKTELVGNDTRATATRRVRTVVEIPFLDELERTRSVVDAVLADPVVDLLILDDNGSTTIGDLVELEADPRVRLNIRGRLENGLSLYTVWNAAVAAAHELDPGRPVNLAFLNNDVRLAPGTIRVLADELRSAPPEIAAVYPDYRRPLEAGVADFALTPTRGTWSKKGLSGFAFMVRAELVGWTVPLFDERYRLIYGDGDFVEELELAGLTAARVDGLPLEHDKSTTLNRERRWAAAVKRADTDARKAKAAERSG